MLDCLAQYLDAAVGALYVRDKRQGTLRRIATYGFSRESEQASARDWAKPTR